MATSSSAISRTDFFTRSLTASQEVPPSLSTFGHKTVRTDIPLDLVEAVHGEIEPVLILVGDEEKVVFDPACGQLLEALVPADAVLGMDDEIPFGQARRRTSGNSPPAPA